MKCGRNEGNLLVHTFCFNVRVLTNFWIERKSLTNFFLMKNKNNYTFRNISVPSLSAFVTGWGLIKSGSGQLIELWFWSFVPFVEFLVRFLPMILDTDYAKTGQSFKTETWRDPDNHETVRHIGLLNLASYQQTIVSEL